MGDFDLKTWLYKGVKRIATVAAASAVVAGADATIAYFTETQNNIPEEYVFWGGLAVIVLQQIANWVKHEYLVE